ncbi:hypothetical protein ETAA8_26820 [Anatilimnocola aggregata]|uniref:Uncharacterized protein n=1 Tax=Anatilimnocola aggregata TaxID=2528021 RepID=A0A517YBK3_9BACT|nr:hypothetical protein [Anatilimnocola aggregata]QDU27594.1 hypothetical protein ETAA8_26820 [Anatilimnocola aggregata]
MDDADLLRRFESQALSRAEWTHRLHVRVAYLYLTQHTFAEALEQIREGIQRLNAANEVPENPNAGYNETMTVAWARLVHTTICEQGTAASSSEFVDRQPHLLASTLLRLFYSKAIWQQHDCKTRFVEPDLAPLPQPRV